MVVDLSSNSSSSDEVEVVDPEDEQKKPAAKLPPDPLATSAIATLEKNDSAGEDDDDDDSDADLELLMSQLFPMLNTNPTTATRSAKRHHQKDVPRRNRIQQPMTILTLKKLMHLQQQQCHCQQPNATLLFLSC